MLLALLGAHAAGRRVPRADGPGEWLRLNPVTAGERYVGKLLTNGHGWTRDTDWLVSPMIAAVALLLLTAVMASSLTLTGWRER